MPRFGDDWSSWLEELDRAFGHQHQNTYGHRTNNPTEIVQHTRVESARRTGEQPARLTTG